MNYKSFVVSSLQEVSKIASGQFGKVTSSTKADDNNQVLTETDLEVGKVLVDRIVKQFPTFNVIDEEAGVINKNSEFTWVVDPIDGTSNFANGIPAYGILLGLLHNENPIVGGMAMPSFSEIYFAEKNKGAYLNGKKIEVSKETKLINALIAYGIDGHQEKPSLTRQECKLLSDLIIKIRNLRSTNSAYDFALVARGAYGAYLNQTSKIWDNVAPQVIIEEAGGKYTDFYGKQIDYSNPLKKSKDNFTYIASSKVLHKQILEVVR